MAYSFTVTERKYGDEGDPQMDNEKHTSSSDTQSNAQICAVPPLGVGIHFPDFQSHVRLSVSYVGEKWVYTSHWRGCPVVAPPPQVSVV